MSASNWRVAAVLAFATLSAADAAPLSGSDLAGREREQFIDKFPQRERAAPLIDFQNEARPTKRRTCRLKNSRKAC